MRRVGLACVCGGAGSGEAGRETRVSRRTGSRRRRKKRTGGLEGEGEIKDPKSGQDGQVSAIGKGNEANPRTPSPRWLRSVQDQDVGSTVSSSTQGHTGLPWRGSSGSP